MPSAIDLPGFFQSTSGLRILPGGSTSATGNDTDEVPLGVGGPSNTGISVSGVENGNGAVRLLPKITSAPGAGSELGSFTYTQNLPASVWVINHDLNTYPTVVVLDSTGGWVIGGIHYDSLNQITLTFSGAFSGKAVCK
jgi:hypothetical protein